ncbi:MAG: hypothetical protein P4L98_18185 [Ancalomicrobiaceae bacterium]|nr:hypothetical protein [Ancalomicrobiaceae bacterium]
MPSKARKATRDLGRDLGDEHGVAAIDARLVGIGLVVRLVGVCGALPGARR